MVLIVVLDAGPSRVEGQPLAPEDAERLRAAYAVEGGAFAVRLDSMPMRQEEMRRP